LSGEQSPITFADISDEIKNSVDHIVKWRQNDNRPQEASTILRLKKGGLLQFLRK
jgi:L-threonylcarbamoyladenylate synthase